MRLHYTSVMRVRLDIVFAIGLVSAGCYLLRSPDSHWFGVFALCASAALALMLFAAFLVLPLLAFRLEPKYRDEYSLVFSPEGIHFRTVHIDSQLAWSIYSRALIDGYSYILYYGSSTFTVIPKRVFQSSEEQSAFERILRQHISKIVKKS